MQDEEEARSEDAGPDERSADRTSPDGGAAGPAMTSAEEFFDGSRTGLAVLRRVRRVLEQPYTVRVTKSQVAFRRRVGFAFLWRPGQYLARPGAEVVLSIALGRRDPSARFKEVAHPARTQWLHHLELQAAKEIDGEVVAWLREAADRAR
jgi:hypothetical protein